MVFSGLIRVLTWSVGSDLIVHMCTMPAELILPLYSLNPRQLDPASTHR